MAEYLLKSISRKVLSSIKVIELEGYPPTSFCGMFLSDYGADVIQISRPDPPMGLPSSHDILNRGKRSVLMNFKNEFHLKTFKQLIPKIDVLIDPYRPGVLEKLGLSPKVLMELNKSLIICRNTGYGQTGPFKDRPGHDLNYLADSGVLSTFGPLNSPPIFPNNLLADFAGGSLMSTLGIVMALFDRNQTGLGQIIDNSMVDSTLYLSSFILSHKRNGIWNEDRGVNILDNGSPFYKVYECGDGKFLCVAAIETLFYRNFLQGLGLEKEKIERMVKKQMDKSLWEETDSLFKGMIKGKGSKEWEEIFEGKEACVSIALNLEEIIDSEMHKERRNFIKDEENNVKKRFEKYGFQISPSLKLSGNSSEVNIKIAKRGEHTLEFLKEMGISNEEIQQYME